MTDEQNTQAQEPNQQQPAQQNQGQDKKKLWTMLCHLSALVSLLIWIPGANILGPLGVWIFKKTEFPSVDTTGKESINFQIWMTIYAVIAFISVVGIFLIPVVGIVNLIFVIIASVKTNNGEEFKYPLIPYRFLK